MTAYFVAPKIHIGSIRSLMSIVQESKHLSVLIISSPTVSKIISVETLITELSIRYAVMTFLAVRPDAPISKLDEFCKNSVKPDLIIAIGGGSVIDSAKALSVCWNDASIIEIFRRQKNLPTQKIPTIAVPTTAGSGAEMSYGSILLDEEKNVKGGIRGAILQPDTVLIDVELYASAPKKLIAECGFDCMTHAMETYLSKSSTPLVRYQSIAAIQTVFRHLERAFFGNRESLGKMALASALMGINLAVSSTCLPHRIQYALGPITNTSHAQGLIILYKGWLQEIRNTPAFDTMAKDLDMSVDRVIEIVHQLKQSMNIDYNLVGIGVNKEQLSFIAGKTTGTLDNDPCYKSIETIEAILKNSL